MSRKTVLVVDDQEVVRRLLSALLRTIPADIVTATSGRDACDILQDRTRNLDLAIVDLILPHGSGWEVVDAIRANPQRAAMPIVVLTGASISKEERARLSSKVSAVVPKAQFDTEAVKQTVMDLLRIHSATPVDSEDEQ